MAFTCNLQFQLLFQARETADGVSAPLLDANSRQKLFNGCDLTALLQSAGGIDLVGDVGVVFYSSGLPAADNDIDLTALPLARNTAETKDYTGMKLVAWAFKCVKENAAGVVVKPGVADGYPLFGSASDRLTLGPGRGVGSCLDADTDPDDIDTPEVDATHKNIRISGTIADSIVGLLVFADPS